MKTKNKWRYTFLGVGIVWVLMELFAMWDRNPETEPFTIIVVETIPWFIGFPVIAFFGLWLIFHFWQYYGMDRYIELPTIKFFK